MLVRNCGLLDTGYWILDTGSRLGYCWLSSDGMAKKGVWAYGRVEFCFICVRLWLTTRSRHTNDNDI